MSQSIRIAAVGDILMIGKLITTSKVPGEDRYVFDPIFQETLPFLQADLTIGNLEIPLAGREASYSHPNRHTGFTMFNCPDELAPMLKRAGFHVLTTGNNHCIDRGEQGLIRTNRLLDEQGILHTGTFTTNPGGNNFLITTVKGIRVGILSYSKSTNKLPLPSGKSWMVNLINPNDDTEVIESFLRMKREVDLTIVCLHFGKEYRHTPPEPQQRLVKKLLQRGAHLILGSHPHVLQPVFSTPSGQTVIYSLGNFASTCLKHKPATKCGVILRVTATKLDDKVVTDHVRCIPTWIMRLPTRAGKKFKILPIRAALANRALPLTATHRQVLNQMHKHASSVLRMRCE